MSHKIIKPEGIELIEYLNNGYAICNRCGAVMRQTEDPKTGCGIYICPSCGLKMDEEDLYLHPCFKGYFDMRSGMATNGLYPTVTIRQIMWALKMKPIKKERWETVFDRRDI